MLKSHKVTPSDYYFQFLRASKSEGFCSECNKPTKYLSMSEGFRKCCSLKCTLKTPDYKKRKHDAQIRAWTPERKVKASLDRKGKPQKKGAVRSAAFKKNLSEYWMGHPGHWKGKKKGPYPKEWCANISKGLQNSEKLREYSIKRARNQCESHGLSFPTMGINEVGFFSAIKRCITNNVVQQKQVCGYLLDGYFSEYNVAIELDEEYHLVDKGQQAKDHKRMCIVANKLKCSFIRIEEADWLDNGQSVINYVKMSLRELKNKSVPCFVSKVYLGGM